MAESPSELRAEIEKLERKHAENPEGRYFVPLANAYRKLGAVEHAESLLRDGLRKHPEYLSAHIVLGRCLADRQATQAAIDEFRYVLSLDPQNLIALRTLGEIALADERPDDAVRWYQELIAVDPMNEEAHRALMELGGSHTPAGAPVGVDEMQLDHGFDWSSVPEATLDDDEDAVPPTSDLVLDEPSDADREMDLVGAQDSSARGGFAEDETIDDDELEGDAVPDEVVTETIAELYARQGFHARAADVLREVIRRRGGDVVLEARLAELERLAASPDGESVQEQQEEPYLETAEPVLEPEAQRQQVDDPDAPLDIEPLAGLELAAESGDLGLDEGGSADWISGQELEPLSDDRDDAATLSGDLGMESVSDLPVAEPDLLPEDSPEDSFAASFSHGFFAADDTTGEAEQPSTSTEPFVAGEARAFDTPRAESEPAPAAASIAGYLAALATWEPAGSDGGASADEGGQEDDLVPGEHEDDEVRAGWEDSAASDEGSGSEPEFDPWWHSDEEAEPEPLREAGPEGSGAADERGIAEPASTDDSAGDESRTELADAAHEPWKQPSGPPATEPTGTGPANDDLFPWEIPSDDDVPSGNEDLDTSDLHTSSMREDVRPEVVSADPSARGVASAPNETDDEAGGAAGAMPSLPDVSQGAGAAEPGAGNDDDLESFQAWLRSLKR